jgi:prepilin-type N-terminal cleavage/methylation domain-containing protein
MRRRPNGFSLLEILAVIAIVGVLAIATAPAFANYRRNASMKAEVAELRGILRAVRSRAIMRGTHAGVKFTRAGNVWVYSLYDDGNDNGIRSAEITSGVDRRYAGPSMLMPQFNIAGIALLSSAIRDPDGDSLPPTASAVQFGSSTICSFSPTGSGTPGTIYITDGAGRLCALRVYGASGRVRVLRYNAAWQRWTQE